MTQSEKDIKHLYELARAVSEADLFMTGLTKTLTPRKLRDDWRRLQRARTAAKELRDDLRAILGDTEMAKDNLFAKYFE